MCILSFLDEHQLGLIGPCKSYDSTKYYVLIWGLIFICFHLYFELILFSLSNISFSVLDSHENFLLSCQSLLIFESWLADLSFLYSSQMQLLERNPLCCHC
uniref:Uncharacterized protein n=1 Tax=Aegilops tauschii subsp. strangulata TaxID=200361 RepID=A0A453NFC5_AEGTS